MIGQYDIRIVQGSGLFRNFTVKALSGALWDFAGRVLAMQVRAAPGQPVLLEATSANGRLKAGVPTTRLELSVDGAVTGTIPVGTFVHDMWVDEVQLVAGTFIVDPRVTVLA